MQLGVFIHSGTPGTADTKAIALYVAMNFSSTKSTASIILTHRLTNYIRNTKSKETELMATNSSH